MKATWRWAGLLAMSNNVMAADLGVWGDLWPVQEQDLLQVISQRIEGLQRSGEWAQEMESFKQRVNDNSQRPPPVRGVIRSTEYTSRLFDPSIQLAQDIRDDQGRVFARRGEVINPLDTVPFMQTLYFIDGDDPAQLVWVKQQQPETPQVKIILVRGDIAKVSAELNSRIYFDQNGVLCGKFTIESVPARITPAPGGRQLNIETFPLEAGR